MSSTSQWLDMTGAAPSGICSPPTTRTASTPWSWRRRCCPASIPREDGYYGAFLRHSAGPAGLSVDAELTYLAAYRQPASLAASVGYYRTAHTDREAVARRARTPLATPVLTVGGQFGMGHGVADCFAQVARHVDHVQIDGAGDYPAEQHPDEVNARLVTFLAANHTHTSEAR